MKKLIVLIPIVIFFHISLNSFAADNSIWSIPQIWTTQNNESLKLSSLAGHPIIATMIYTSCKGVCPLMVSDIIRLDKKLTNKEQKNMRYVLFSLDPKRDTPSALKTFAKKMKLDSRWTLLTSNDSQVREMSALLGFQYKRFEDGNFTHSSTLFFVDSKGELATKRERNSDDTIFINTIKSKHLLSP